MHAHQDRPAAPVRDPLIVTMIRMRRLLETARPSTDAEAMRLLRGVFPDSTLAERVAALARTQDR